MKSENVVQIRCCSEQIKKQLELLNDELRLYHMLLLSLIRSPINVKTFYERESEKRFRRIWINI